MTTTEHLVRWAGFTWTDRAPWRLVSCNTCGKSHHLMHASPESTEALVRAHRCGPIGTPWSVPQSGTAVPHAFLLSAMAAEVHRQPFGSYTFPEVDDAACELIAALASQLPPGRIRIEWPDDEGVDPYVTTERDEAEAVALRAVQGDVAVSVAQLVDVGSRVPLSVDLGDALAVIGPTGTDVIGVAWPEWDQCIDHVAADIRSGRLTAIHDPAIAGRLIFAGEPSPACSGCAVPPTGQVPAVPS